MSSKDSSDNWIVESSLSAKNCRNLIREIVDTLDLQPNRKKTVVSLSIGDPTVYGNLKPPSEAIQAVMDVVQAGDCNGYAPSVGYESSRAAVAQYLSHGGAAYSAKDIILCSGCSSAIDLAITALCDEKKNHNLLVPRPGFSLYQTQAEAIGIKIRPYYLKPDDHWRVDLKHLEAQIDKNTAAIILNNPSNPCGAVYDEDHLRDILMIAYRHRVPVIADEIYERMVFSGHRFVSTGALGIPVPILVCGGLAKRYLVPGWRLGWIAIYDPAGGFSKEVRKGLVSLSQRIIGSNTLIQGALPAILFNTPQTFHDNLMSVVEKNAKAIYKKLLEGKGIHPDMPQGAMYMMVKIDLDKFPFDDDLQFVVKLMEEESVFCLPGSCFQVKGFIRVVTTVPENLLMDACERIIQFCDKYYQGIEKINI